MSKRNFPLLSFSFSLLSFVGVGSCLQVQGQQSPQNGSVTVAIAPQYDSVRKSHRFYFGENYRKIWATPVPIRVMNLATEKGGLTIVERGGGMQTKSLRLKDKSGKEWALRSVQKDPEMALPPNLRATVAKDIIQDQISSSHPYGAITVPPLAAALGLSHPNPEVVFMPDDPALGEHRADFANTVLLLEEREPLDAKDTDNTEKLLENLRKDNDFSVDQQQVLRARLLDIIIGDWDRHEDQWRWVQNDKGEGAVYTPFPRDRDQVYFIAEGLIPAIASRKWLLPKFQGFHHEIRDIRGFNFNARYFDRAFLNSLSEEDWTKEIANVQSLLTDDVLQSAVRLLPEKVYALSGEEILSKMKARRNNLKEEGLQYYRFLAEEVDIPASDKTEWFEVNNEGEGLTVTVKKLKKDSTAGKTIYQRRFDPNHTKEVRLYGQGGEDVFTVNGSAGMPIKLRMIGGEGRDSFAVAGITNRSSVVIYDQAGEGNILPDPNMAKRRIKRDSANNAYNHRAFQYNRLMPLITTGFNLDDGWFIGGGFMYQKHKFRKAPYAARHRLMAGHALATRAFFFNYAADWKQLGGGKLDASVEIDARAPFNTSNFFGVGNNTTFTQTGKRPIRYYRSRYDFINASARLHRAIGNSISLNAGIAGQFYSNNQKDNEGRFITIYNNLNPEEEVFSTKWYGGIVCGITINTRNNNWLPSRGVLWNTTGIRMNNLKDFNTYYGQVRSDFSFYFSPVKDTGLIISNTIGGGITVGRPTFFQHLFLGGNNNLRGYRNFRFAGKSMFYHNIDVGIRLFNFTSYLFPGTFGISVFNDVGRVWAPGETSDLWHHGYGGGIFIIPAQLVVLKASVGVSKEGALPYISVGVNF